MADSAPAGGLTRRLRSPQDGEILRLALPAFGALIAEPLFLLADSAIVGRLGTVPLGGLGVATFITLLLVPVLYSIFVMDLKIVRWGTVESHVDPHLGPATGKVE